MVAAGISQVRLKSKSKSGRSRRAASPRFVAAHRLRMTGLMRAGSLWPHARHGEQRATIFFAQVLLLVAVGRLLRRTARCDRPIARWDHSGTERFWRDLAGRPTGDLSDQFVRPADAQRCLGHWRAPPIAVHLHGGGFGAREEKIKD
jgi:hypothetical protein